MKNIIGIDISKSYFDADINRGVIRYNNDENGIADFIKSLQTQSHCIMESTSTYGERLAWELHQAGHVSYIVNPLSVKHFAKMRLSKVKTDKSDAKLLTDYGKMNIDDLKPVSFPDESIQSAKQMENIVSQLKKQRTALENQMEAISCQRKVSRDAITALKQTIDYLSKQIETLESKIVENVKKTYPDQLDKADSVKGIGVSTACRIIVATDGFTGFENARQLSSYFGCCPRVTESGSSVRGRGSISKIGLSEIRTMLYMCAISASRFNESCKQIYQRLLAKGKPKKVALLAVVNKLIRQIFAVVSKNEFFDNSYEKKFGF